MDVHGQNWTKKTIKCPCGSITTRKTDVNRLTNQLSPLRFQLRAVGHRVLQDWTAGGQQRMVKWTMSDFGAKTQWFINFRLNMVMLGVTNTCSLFMICSTWQDAPLAGRELETWIKAPRKKKMFGSLNARKTYKTSLKTPHTQERNKV